MEIKEYFLRSETWLPAQAPRLRRVSFALRRGGPSQMEELCRLWPRSFRQLADVREIGEKRLSLIEKVHSEYREGSSGEWLEPELLTTRFLMLFFRNIPLVSSVFCLRRLRFFLYF